MGRASVGLDARGSASGVRSDESRRGMCPQMPARALVPWSIVCSLCAVAVMTLACPRLAFSDALMLHAQCCRWSVRGSGQADESACVLECIRHIRISEYIGTCRNIWEHIGLYWNISEYIGMHRNILEYIGMYRNMLEYIRIYRNILECNRNMSEHIGLYWDISEYIGMHRNILEYIGMYWNACFACLQSLACNHHQHKNHYLFGVNAGWYCLSPDELS